MKRYVLFTMVILASLYGRPAVAANTNLTQVINPGALQLTSPTSATLSPVTLNVTQAQTSTGSLGQIVATDSRGSGAGWAVTATASNWTRAGSVVRTAGSSGGGNLTGGGSYTGTTAGTYTITISTAGPAGFAKFTVSGLETQAETIASSTASIGTRGILGLFSSGMYAAGDQWTITIDTLPVTGVTLSPSGLLANTGSLAGVSAGGAHTFTSEVDPTTIMSASSGNGMGQYLNSPSISVVIPPTAKAGSYNSVITETIN